MITRRLAAFAAELDYQDLPPAAIETAKRLLLDGLGCLLAGTPGKPAASAARMAGCLGGNPQATVFATQSKNSACHAAFVNGITLYSVGLNDFLQRAGAHPGACVIPTLLAVGEWQRSSGKELLAAMAGGYEIIDRVARSIMPSHRQRGFHPTGTCGTFGATAAAARLLRLDSRELASAFGIAGSQAAGLYEYINDGTSTIMFHAGRAAKNGVEAALLSKEGLTGPATVLEGNRGFFKATSDAEWNETALSQLGQHFALEEVTFRPYFGCTSTIAASGATAQVSRRRAAANAKPEGVKNVKVFCNPVVAADNAEADPQTLLAARLSLPFNVALVLARGDVMVRDLEEKDLWDKRVRKLLPVVELISDQGIPRFGSTVKVTFENGEAEEASMHSWRGDASDPLPWSEVVLKFERLVQGVIGVQDKETVVQTVANIQDTDASVLASVLSDALRSKNSSR